MRKRKIVTSILISAFLLHIGILKLFAQQDVVPESTAVSQVATSNSLSPDNNTPQDATASIRSTVNLFFGTVEEMYRTKLDPDIGKLLPFVSKDSEFRAGKGDNFGVSDFKSVIIDKIGDIESRSVEDFKADNIAVTEDSASVNISFVVVKKRRNSTVKKMIDHATLQLKKEDNAWKIISMGNIVYEIMQ